MAHKPSQSRKHPSSKHELRRKTRSKKRTVKEDVPRQSDPMGERSMPTAEQRDRGEDAPRPAMSDGYDDED